MPLNSLFLYSSFLSTLTNKIMKLHTHAHTHIISHVFGVKLYLHMYELFSRYMMVYFHHCISFSLLILCSSQHNITQRIHFISKMAINYSNVVKMGHFINRY